MSEPVALVIGAGDATGGAIARRFARGGYTACVTRRSLEALQPLVDQIRAEGGQAQGFASDARKEEEVVALVEQIESTIGPIEVLVFNIGANVPCSILDETARKYFKIWEMACLGGFLNGREVARRMVTRTSSGASPDHPVHRGHRFVARRRWVCGLCRREACPAGSGAKHGARVGAAGYPCGACRD
jgi:NAD(P)-dependent dehydrogenase (short-subunit alcohol dehydrogenase family)